MGFEWRAGAPFPGPAEASGTATAMEELPYAGFWRRALAFLIDGLLFAGVWLLLAILIAVAGAIAGLSDQVVNDAVGWPLLLALLAFVWLYSTLLESGGRQATLGKLATGILVADLDARRLSWARANLRLAGKLFSIATFSIGFLVAAFTARKQALHDLMAGTIVLKTRVEPESPLGPPDPVRLRALTGKFVPQRLSFFKRGKRKNLLRGIEALAAVLQPDEDLELFAYTVIGPSPLLLYELGGVYAEMIFLKPYYIAVTNRRVLLMTASRWSGRARGLSSSDSRGAVSADRFKPGLFRYSAFFLRGADGNVRRLNFRRMLWKEEAAAIFQSLAQGPL